jgi:hypothetical protein
MRKILFLFTILIWAFTAKAQVNIRDSSIFTPIITASYAYQVPGGDLAKRFGNNSNIGGSIIFKTKKNWTFGVDGSYIFGGNLREGNMFDSIAGKANNGVGRYIIDASGEFADIRVYERGYNLSLNVGKIISNKHISPNPNCGIMVQLSAGFLQHKIRIEDIGNKTPQMTDPYKKGYDRLTNGISATGFIGYIYLSNRRLVNFFGGFEFTQAWTENRRTTDFDTMKHDDTKRIDQLWGLRVGWVIPLYKKVPRDYYYN